VWQGLQNSGVLGMDMALQLVVADGGMHSLQVAESKFLNNRLVDIVAFMENIAVKDSLDKVCMLLPEGFGMPAHCYQD
jgi:hypothetical protein